MLDPERLSSEMNESIEYYHTNKNSAGTKYSAFKWFLETYGLDNVVQDQLVINYAKRLEPRGQRMRKIGKKWISFPEVKKLANSMDANLESKVISMLMFETCARISEILSLTQKDLILDDNLVVITSWKTANKVSNARRTMKLTDRTAEEFREYIKACGYKSGEGLFSYNYWRFWSRFKKYAFDTIGYEITPHWMRASSAVYLIREGFDIQTVKEYGGWETVQALEGYLRESGITSEKIMRMEKFKW